MMALGWHAMQRRWYLPLGLIVSELYVYLGLLIWWLLAVAYLNIDHFQVVAWKIILPCLYPVPSIVLKGQNRQPDCMVLIEEAVEMEMSVSFHTPSEESKYGIVKILKMINNY